MAAVLEVLDLRKRYRPRDPWAVEGVSFKLEEGQAFGLLGPNGAGKSTVVKAIVGLTRPASGTISVFGSSPGDVAADHVVRVCGGDDRDQSRPRFGRCGL